MRDNLVEQTIPDVMSKQADISPEVRIAVGFAGCNITEFVDTALGHTIGPVIANVDNQLHEVTNTSKKYRPIGTLGTRTSASPQIFVTDEAIRTTNSEIISIELAHDTKGGGGHGCLAISDASDVPDVRRAVEVALSGIKRTIGNVCSSSAGYLEFQYTARVSYALNKALGAPIGKSFGIICASPAMIGLVITDVAAKSVVADPVGYASPSQGTSLSSEVIFILSGDSDVVHQAVIAARGAGLQLLSTLNPAETKSTTMPYIQASGDDARGAVGR